MKILDDMHKIEARVDIPAFLKKYGLNKRICEIGVRYGYFIQQLLACDPELLIGIDHWSKTENDAENDVDLSQRRCDAIYQDVFKRFVNEPAVKLFRGFSAGGAQILPDFSQDFIYIDADHSYEACLHDIGRYWKKIRQGGILAGHDYIEARAANGTPFGVTKAVDQFVEEHEIRKEDFHVTKFEHRSWMVLKLQGE